MNFKEIAKTASNLLIICLCVGALLALANQLTLEPIKAQEAKATLENRQKLLPADEYVDLFTSEKGKLDDDLIAKLKEKKVFSLVKAVKDGVFIGYVIETGKSGYSSVIKTMYGVNSKYQIVSILVKEQAETPGLGDKIMKEPFIGQFKNKGVTSLILTKSDNDNIRAITGATISSRAMTESVHDSLEAVMAAIKEQISRKKGVSVTPGDGGSDTPAISQPMSDNRMPATTVASPVVPENPETPGVSPVTPGAPESSSTGVKNTEKSIDITPEENQEVKENAPEPVQINFNIFGSPVYACGERIDPKLKEILPAKDYVQVMPGAFKAVDNKGKTVGYVAKAVGRGYAGDIVVGYSADPAFNIITLRILKQNETPGYGDKTERTDFLEQFRGKTTKTLVLKKNPVKSKEYISAITHATISSTAVVESVRSSLEKIKTSAK
jgi:electron transport complex protein RnfG